MSIRSKVARLVAVISLVAVVLPVASVAAHSASSGANAAVKRIFVIMLENHGYQSVIGDSNAPYITSLANDYGEATNYYGVTHPSQPNYVAAIAGQFDPARMNDEEGNTFDYTNLVDQLESHGKTWGAYMESLPYAGYTGARAPGSIKLYTNKHNPFVLMDDVLSSPARLANIKPYTNLASDLNSSHAPDFVWISPNQCNDMHGGVYDTIVGAPETPCPYGTNAQGDVLDGQLKAKADAFVKSAVATIRNSKAWTGNSVIFVLADEADYGGDAYPETDLWADVSGCCDSPGYGIAPAIPAGFEFEDNGPGHFWAGGPFGGGKVPAIVIARNGVRGIKDATPYNHYSLLRTIEEVWNLGYLGYAADSANVSSMTYLLQH